MRLLVTGTTGKVGWALIDKLAGVCENRALCHNRPLDVADVDCVFGTIAERETVRRAMGRVTHVVNLATCKETPDDIMGVAGEGLFGCSRGPGEPHIPAVRRHRRRCRWRPFRLQTPPPEDRDAATHRLHKLVE